MKNILLISLASIALTFSCKPKEDKQVADDAPADIKSRQLFLDVHNLSQVKLLLKR